jgi:hypothetical protein
MPQHEGIQHEPEMQTIRKRNCDYLISTKKQTHTYLHVIGCDSVEMAAK